MASGSGKRLSSWFLLVEGRWLKAAEAADNRSPVRGRDQVGEGLAVIGERVGEFGYRPATILRQPAVGRGLDGTARWAGHAAVGAVVEGIGTEQEGE